MDTEMGFLQTCLIWFLYVRKFSYGRMEKIKINSVRSQAKIIGTVATVAGAMLMTLVKGPVIELFRAKGSSTPELQKAGLTLKHSIKGSLMITVGCFSWAAFMNLQVRQYTL